MAGWPTGYQFMPTSYSLPLKRIPIGTQLVIQSAQKLSKLEAQHEKSREEDDNGIDSDMEEDETDAGSSEDEDSPLDANEDRGCLEAVKQFREGSVNILKQLTDLRKTNKEKCRRISDLEQELAMEKNHRREMVKSLDAQVRDQQSTIGNLKKSLESERKRSESLEKEKGKAQRELQTIKESGKAVTNGLLRLQLLFNGTDDQDMLQCAAQVPKLPQNLPQVTTTRLTDFISAIASKWYRVAHALGVGEKAASLWSSEKSAEDKCLQTLEAWIERGVDCTWKKLIEVLCQQHLNIVAQNICHSLEVDGRI